MLSSSLQIPSPWQRKSWNLKLTPFIPVASAIEIYLRKDSRNKIYFWYCPSKVKWLRHQLVDDHVKASICTPTLPSKDSYLFSRKKECDNMIHEWQTFFANDLKKGYHFLNFKDERQQVIKPTYARGSSWLPAIGFTNSLCA